MSWGRRRDTGRAYPKGDGGRQGKVGGRGSSMSGVHRRRGQDRLPQDKTLFGEPKSKTASEHIHIDTPAHAEESIGWLNGQWEGGSREQRVKAVQYSNEAANRAFVTANNPRVSEGQRKEAATVYAKYRVWTDAHKGKE